MKEYLIEGAHGNYYTSTDNYNSIMSYICDCCGEGDWIITSWDDQIENDMYEKLYEYVVGRYFVTEDAFKEFLSNLYLLNYFDTKTFTAYMIHLKASREHEKEDSEIFVNNLFNNEIIDKEIKRKLLYNNTKAYNTEQKIIYNTEPSVLNELKNKNKDKTRGRKK